MPRGGLTTVVARVWLDMLRARAARREDALDTHVPDPIVHESVSLSVIAFAIADGKVVEMNILADKERLARLDLSAIAP